LIPDRASSSFAAIARAHLKVLEDAGESPEEIASELSAVANSYVTDGLEEEGQALRELVRQYLRDWIKTDISPHPNDG
jgi:hypothetical protein